MWNIPSNPVAVSVWKEKLNVCWFTETLDRRDSSDKLNGTVWMKIPICLLADGLKKMKSDDRSSAKRIGLTSDCVTAFTEPGCTSK